MHAIAVTENYIIIPETSYLRNPCDWITGSGAGYNSVDYNEKILGRFSVIPKENPENVQTIETDTHFFITHHFNAFEDTTGVIQLDVINYDSPEPYTQFTYIHEAVFGTTSVKQELRRYSIDLNANTVSHKKLHPLPENDYIEFPNCNPNYAGKPYRYG